MITAVDTVTLCDLLAADRRHGASAVRLLRRCQDDGQLIACELVVAEVAALFASSARARSAIERLGVELVAGDVESALRAADAWRRQRTGRRLPVARFLIGSHALGHADRLATRDRAFYRKHFSGLKLALP